MNRQSDPLAHAHEASHRWLITVSRHLGTDDQHYAYRVLRAWLHIVRDRLTIEVAAHLSAQLPELLRGVFYEGWRPSRVPVRYDAGEFIERFAREATVGAGDVPAAASAVSAALAELCSPGQLDHALGQLPRSLRDTVSGGDSRERETSHTTGTR